MIPILNMKEIFGIENPKNKYLIGSMAGKKIKWGYLI